MLVNVYMGVQQTDMEAQVSQIPPSGETANNTVFLNVKGRLWNHLWLSKYMGALKDE